jgi:hypothetical protein
MVHLLAHAGTIYISARNSTGRLHLKRSGGLP